MDKHVLQKKGFALAARAGGFSARLRTSETVRRVYAEVQQLVLAFLLARGTMFGGYAPFGVAAVAASAGVGTGYAAAVGLMLGSLLLRGGLYGVTASAAGVLALVCAHVFERDLRRRSWFMPVAAALCMAACGFVLIETFTPASVARFVCAVAAAGVLTACYQLALGPPGPARLSRPAGLVAVTASVLIALSDLTILGTIAPARVLAMFLVLGASYLGGSATGTVVGVALGAALDASGTQGAFFTCVYGLSALIAGAFQGAGKVGFAIAALTAGLGAALVGADHPIFVFALYETVFAVLLFAAVPQSVWQYGKDCLRPARRDTIESLERLRRAAGKYANEASAAFYELYLALLSGAEHGKAEANEEVHAVFDRAADAVCSRCPACETCWQKDSVATLDAFTDMAIPMLRRGRAEADDFPESFRARCAHLPELVRAVNDGLGALRERQEFRRRCDENRTLVAQQYAGLTDILRQVGGSLSSNQASLPARERQVRSYAQAFGKIEKVAVFHDANGRLRVELMGPGAGRILHERRGFAAGLSALLGCGLTEPELISDELGERVMLREQAPFRVVVGVSQRQKQGEKVSGDTGRSFVTDDGRACMLLADGMGTGDAASRDSRLLLSMMERFLRAGIPAEDAVRTVGPAFRMRVEGMRGVTLDALSIDLFTGKAGCLKCGAAPSYLRTGGSVTALTGDALPIGLLDRPDEARTVPLRMKHGDLFVMLSDGVSDGTDDGWVRRLLTERAGDSPKELAARLVMAAAARGAEDDLTALVVRLERRKPANEREEV